jgi:peptide/nickel transport system permease protein
VRAFLLRRVLAAAPLLLGSLTLLFLLLQLVPGRPFTAEAGAGVSPVAAERLRRISGADQPIAARYLAWVGGMLGGDLGYSWSERRPVADAVQEAASRTLLLTGTAIALQFAIGLGLGLLAAAAGPRLDRLLTAVAGILYSVPSFWLGLLLVGFFSVRLGWLPVSQIHSSDAGAWGTWPRLLDAARHLVLPCLALALPGAGGIALFVRDEVRAALAEGLALSARSRGLGRTRMVLRHGAGRALLAVSVLFGLAIPGLLGGSVVIETLFAWPGMGRLAYQGTLARDEPLVLGCAGVAALLVIAGSLAADVLSAAVDPRVRESLR